MAGAQLDLSPSLALGCDEILFERTYENGIKFGENPCK